MAKKQSFQLRDEHCELLVPLTSKIRVLTHDQIARTFYVQAKNKEQALQGLITELQEAGLLKTFTSIVHPEIELEAPLCSYAPGDPVPDFAPIASKTRGRWKSPPIPTQIVYATMRAKKVLGGFVGGKKPRLSETRHDIHVAQIYLHVAKQDPVNAAAWIPEDQLRQERDGSAGSLPDALLRTDNPVIIEFGGAYPKAKLEAFHHEQYNHSYQIW